jgi:Mrp family chromosome partitioning ATPase
MVDMVLMWCSTGARKQLIRDALRVLARTDTRIVGAVLNKIDTERDHYYYSYYYSRYYHYGYGPHGTHAQPGATAEAGKAG